MPEITTDTTYRTETGTHFLVWDGDMLLVLPRKSVNAGEQFITAPEQARDLADALEAMAKLMEQEGEG